MSPHGQDPLLSLMKEHHIPLTRENYLTLAYMGNPPPWSPELEEQIPVQFQDWKSQSFGPSKGTVSSQEHHGQHLGKKHFHNLSVEELEELGKIT